MPDETEFRIDADGSEVAPGPARRRSGWNWALLLTLLALVGVLGFGVGMVVERVALAGGSLFDRGSGPTGPDAALDASYPHYSEIKRLLEDEYFYRPTDPAGMATFEAERDRQAQLGVAAVAATPVASMADYQRQLDYGASRGLTTDLPDVYTVFLEPAANGDVAEQLQGEYEGIGVWVERPEGKYLVVAPIPDSPAEKAGIRSGDVIVAADGTKLEGLDSDAALGKIRGPAGTRVRLTIERPGVAGTFDLEVERAAIVIPSVSYTTLDDGRAGLIRLSIFGDKTTEQLDAAIKQAKADGVQGLVLDLRGNGGGWVDSAREVIGRFVPPERGAALYEDESPSPDNPLSAESIIGGGETWYDLPLVVLVDGGSASASEIVAGALRDYGRAKLVGTHTFGKGLVQRVHDFADGSSARITFAQWLTPNKTPIPPGGLQPDVLVEPPAAPPAAATPGATPLASPAATPGASPVATPLAAGAGQSEADAEDDPQVRKALEVLFGDR